MRALIAATADEQIELVDGVKVHLGRDWALLYPDQDRPLFHILAEADTLAQAEAHAVRFRALLDECIKDSLTEVAL